MRLYNNAPLSALSENLVTSTREELNERKLREKFFDRPTAMVACDLLGKVLVHDTQRGLVAGLITETEAYFGRKDPACHAASGDTERNKIFNEVPGTVYVFSSYGIYNCTNVLTSGDDPAGCVLLRGAEPLIGVDIMERNRRTHDRENLSNGPGKLSDAFGISRRLNRHLITEQPLIIIKSGLGPLAPSVGARIGITKGAHYPFRYFLSDSAFVSRANGQLSTEKG